MKPFESNVSSKYGAPMGRRSYKLTGKLHLARVPFVDGDYDPGGAYWGNNGVPLWCAWSESDEYAGEAAYVRAATRDEAKQLIEADWSQDEVTFYR